MFRFFTFLFRLFALPFILLLNTRCAQIMPLSGGERDLSPPQIVRQYPENNALNFKGAWLEIEFDENIQLKNFQEQLIVTPRLSFVPLVAINGKVLRIKLTDSLIPNRTYIFSLGNSVADVHEGNILSDLRITFSTGNSLDSASLSGKIVDALTQKPVSDSRVFLYENGNDSCFYKDKPDYYSKSDKEGKYIISSVHPGKYKVVAIGDRNKNFLYDKSEETIDMVFTSENNLVSITDSMILDFAVYREIPSRVFVKRVISSSPGKSVVILNRGLSKPGVKLISGENGYVGHWFTEGRDTLNLFYNQTLPDSTKWLIFESDESNWNKKQLIDTFRVITPKIVSENKKSVPKIQIDAEKDELTFTFSTWIKEIKSNKVFFIAEKDTIVLNTEMIDNRHIKVINKKDVLQDGKFIFTPGFIRNHVNETNDTIVLPFQPTNASSTAQLTIYVKYNSLKNKGILELVNEKEDVIRKKIFLKQNEKEEIIWEGLPQGNYHLRLIEDNDGNEAWTTGDIQSKRKPEKVLHYEKSISLLNSWESTVSWEIPE